MPSLRLPILGLAFFLSGAAALVYQVAWQRILALQSGVGIYSIAMIVAAFMAGLGTGSHLGGVLSARVAPWRALRLFLYVEAGIAAFGAASCWLYYDFLYLRHAALYASPWRAGLLHFLGLLLPTVLMGTSLPLLVRAVVTQAEDVSRRVGLLYGLNVLGAAAGALLAPWVLMRHLGIRGAVLAAAGGNLLAALLVFVLDRTTPVSSAPAPAEETPAPARGEPAGSHPLALWVVLYACSGFCALSLEILWFRIMDVAVKSTAFTFGTVLAMFLLGSGAGSLVGSAAARRIQRPLRLFLLCQCALLAYAAAGVIAIAVLPVGTPIYEWFFRFWDGRLGDISLGASDETGALLRLYLLLPLVLFGPPTVLMGLSFPILQRAVHDDPEQSGRRVGFLQAANIAGCTAGSLLVGLWLLTSLGTTGTLRLLLVAGVGFAVVGWACYGLKSLFPPAAAVLAALAALVPTQDVFWQRLHGRTGAERTFIEEDATAVIGLIGDFLNRWGVWVNGKTDSIIPWGGLHTMLGAVPVLAHPEPRDVAIIGLGSGNTAWAAGARPETQRVVVFEICAPQLEVLHRLAASEYAFPKLDPFLKDPRYTFRVADGRNALELEDATYDVIELDALRPRSAYAGNLYSAEFFRLCARRLRPGGLMCAWGPTRRVRETFPTVFPHVVSSGDGVLLLGSRDPIAFEPETWLARLQQARRYLGGPRTDEIGYHLAAYRPMDPEEVSATELNHDLFPRDEFITPRSDRR